MPTPKTRKNRNGAATSPPHGEPDRAVTSTADDDGNAGSSESPSSRRPSSTIRKELVERQIFESATALFAERGFAGTSLQDIALAAGLTRPALYYYFSNKDELLARLVRDTTMDAAQQLESVGADHPDLGPAAHLHELVHRSTLFQAEHRDQFRLLLRSEAELPEDLLDLYAEGRRRVFAVFTSAIEAGVSSGAFRPADPKTVALGLIGMVNWVAWWHHSDNDFGRVADEFADMAVASVLLHHESRAATLGSARGVLAILKEDIALLESRLDD